MPVSDLDAALEGGSEPQFPDGQATCMTGSRAPSMTPPCDAEDASGDDAEDGDGRGGGAVVSRSLPGRHLSAW